MRTRTSGPRHILPARTVKTTRKADLPDLSGPLARQALADDAAQQDRLAAREIRARMAVQRRLTRERIQAMLADLQTQLFVIYQEVMLRRQKSFDEVAKQWSKLMLG